MEICLEEHVLIKHYACYKAFNISKNPKYIGYQCGLASMVQKNFDNESLGGDVTNNLSETLAMLHKSAINGETISNQQLAEELHKSITRKFEKQKITSSFKDNIWSADLADMQLISKYKKKDFDFYVINIFSKCAWDVPLNDKKRY